MLPHPTKSQMFLTTSNGEWPNNTTDLKRHCHPNGEQLGCFQLKKNRQEPGALRAWVTQGLTWKLSFLLLLWQLSTESRSGGQTPGSSSLAGGWRPLRLPRERDLWETQWWAHLTEPRGAGCSVPPFQGMAGSCPQAPWTTGALLRADVVQNDHTPVLIHGSP